MTPPFHFIDNRWVAPATGATLPMIDPSDGKPFAAIACGHGAGHRSGGAGGRARARRGLGTARARRRRAACSAKLARAILDHADELALIEARDCGKPMKQARADVAACARYFEFYGGASDKLHGDTIPYPAGYTVLTWREPHGVTGHIIPWNYPLQIFGRSVGGALAAGNACVVKPAEDACLSLLRVAELAAGIGLPEGALNIVTGLGREAGAALATHRGIEHLSFTGSPATGAWVAGEAAKRHCPVTLELGGKGAQIVFADADLDAALPVIVNAIVQNAGQTCSAGSRLLVERSRYEEVLEKLGARFAALKVGPALADLDCGPLIRAEPAGARARVSRRRGARRPGDGRRRGRSWPMRRRAATTSSRTCCATCRRRPASGARRCSAPCSRRCRSPTRPTPSASPTPPTSDWSPACGRENGARQLRMARAIRSGQVFVNNYGAGGGVELPFGGVKHSGYGREKGFEALYGFTVLKTVVIQHG